MKLKLKAPAKINLGLRILGRLDNGFHEVETIYAQIGLFDLIELEDINERIIDFPDKNNLVYEAAELLIKDRGVKIKLEKKIPSGAGLGGGSSDAAAVLKGLNKLWDLGLSEKELAKLGLKLGSDVGYQVAGGIKKEIQGGDKAGQFKDLGKIVKGWIVVCVPEIFISSQEAYKRVEYDKINKHGLWWQNDFEIWTFKQYPEIKKIKERLLKLGAEKALMSGKGSAVFGWFKDRKPAKEGERELKKQYNQVFMAKIL
ncbi:MAG: 4-(cytidine 5'-diphospho)-2-C-methyl-D-erythritol kinase [Candidatus Beckwithbacteria bacterium]